MGESKLISLYGTVDKLCNAKNPDFEPPPPYLTIINARPLPLFQDWIKESQLTHLLLVDPFRRLHVDPPLA